MYNQILEALKTKFAGISDAVLIRIATKMAKTVTDEQGVKTAIEGLTLQQVIDSYADSRVSEATETAIKNYEAKHGLKDGKTTKPQTTEAPPNKGGDVANPKAPQQPPSTDENNIPTWAQRLIESNNELSTKLTAMEQKNVTQARRQQVGAIVAKLPDNLRKPYDRISLEGIDEKQFATLLTEINTEVEGISGVLRKQGAIFGRPLETQGGNKTSELSKQQLETIAKREGIIAEDKQPF